MNNLKLGPAKLLEITKKFLECEIVAIAPYGKGSINETFLVLCGKKSQTFILQRLNKIFGPAVLDDMEAVSNCLAQNGLVTPQLVRTKANELGYITNDECWRMLTFIPGETYEGKVSLAGIKSAAALIGSFHHVLCGLKYDFRHNLLEFHDTPLKMSQLAEVLRDCRRIKKYAALNSLAEEVLADYLALPKTLFNLPNRVIHGDLKISNVRFDENGVKALCLLDLDTLGKSKVVVDLGDAFRSWCNPAEEDDEANSRFDLEIFKVMAGGYASTAKFLTSAEIKAIPEGIETIMLELSARFITDAFSESYFKLDSSRYRNLFEQNMAKARAQMKLYRDFVAQKEQIVRIIDRL